MSASDPESWKHSEGELFRLLVENVRDYAIFVTDQDGIVRSWNAGAERLLGYREEEILGQSADVFFTREDVALGIPEAERQAAVEVGGGNDDPTTSARTVRCSGMMTALRDDNGRSAASPRSYDRSEWKRLSKSRPDKHGSRAPTAIVRRHSRKHA